MGKASKWMMNFLLGRKEEKDKKKVVAFLEENVATPSGILPSTPTIKRRWSFGKSTSNGRTRRSSKSLDLITANPDVTRAIVELQNQQNNTLALAATAPIERVVAPKRAREGISNALQDAAATKIQAIFRSYLARKALYALKGLVKLQALVRGHIVRKQTAAALRRMHAVMAIQVRARFQRLQIAEESQLIVRSRSSRHGHIPLDIGFTRIHTEAIDTNLYETHEISKSKYGYLNHSQIGRVESGATTFFSGELSISKREHHQYEEISFSTAQNTPKHYHALSNSIPGRASFTYQKPDYAHPPNYMANTESSRAKSRSHSEPKQRPKSNMKRKTKRTASMDGNTILPDSQTRSSQNAKRVVHGNQEPWFSKLYQSKRFLRDNKSDANKSEKFLRDNESDANSTASRSNYCNSIMDYEPHVTMY